mgnify:CR=1 FL=1
MFLFLAKLLYGVRLWEEVVTISHGKIVQLICNFAWLKTKVCCWIDCKYIVFIKLQRCCLVFIKQCVLLYVAPFLWEHVIERPCLLKLQDFLTSSLLELFPISPWYIIYSDVFEHRVIWMNLIVSNVMDYGKRLFSFIFMFQAFCCEINVIWMQLMYLSLKLGALYCEI